MDGICHWRMDAVGYAGRLQLWHDVHRLLVGKIMTGYDSKRRIALDRLDDDDIQVYAQPSNGPVAWGFRSDDGEIYDCICPKEHADCEGEYTVPLYTAPPQRPWVGLTNEDRLCAKYMQDAPDGIEAVIDYIEAKLKELNT